MCIAACEILEVKEMQSCRCLPASRTRANSLCHVGPPGERTRCVPGVKQSPSPVAVLQLRCPRADALFGCDIDRKGFIDGRIARLPTVIVRPGPPNPAATGCFSSVPKAVLHVRILTFGMHVWG